MFMSCDITAVCVPLPSRYTNHDTHIIQLKVSFTLPRAQPPCCSSEYAQRVLLGGHRVGADVTLTDTVEVLPLLRRNCELNLGAKRVKVMELDWLQPGEARPCHWLALGWSLSVAGYSLFIIGWPLFVVSWSLFAVGSPLVDVMVQAMGVKAGGAWLGWYRLRV